MNHKRASQSGRQLELAVLESVTESKQQANVPFGTESDSDEDFKRILTSRRRGLVRAGDILPELLERLARLAETKEAA
jgi:hypothetical protein